MGQTNSSSRHGPDLESQLDPVFQIDTAEKFQSQFNYHFRHDCLPLVDRYNLREAFGFSPDTECDVSEGNLAWDKHALTEFLSAAVPVELKADLNVAGPLLLKAMIRLGSFPFHNGPTSSTLGADEAFVAITFLLRMHEDATGFSFENEDDDDDDRIQQLRDRWFHRLLFQVMSEKPELDPQDQIQEKGTFSSRSPADDEHIIQARKFLEEFNYTRDMGKPKVLIRLPSVIEVSELPSSRSCDLTGTVSKEEFRALLKVLCELGNHTSIDVDQLVKKHGTDWHGFEAVLTELEPHFSSGFRQLFDPFIHFTDRLGDSGHLKSEGVEKSDI
ncbi:hypothetical protein GGS26DRAFT_556614 [Hypomontagnella submonticulosa]|nr:hypothetical protein GGS26DRAFT_556614 [Hypomontagnella submonticulosa]